MTLTLTLALALALALTLALTLALNPTHIGGSIQFSMPPSHPNIRKEKNKKTVPLILQERYIGFK